MLLARKAPVIRRAPTLPMPSELLEANPTPDVITVPARTVLAIEGAGAPEDAAYASGLAALSGIAYSLKFARKNGGGTPFKIGPMESRWWAAVDDGEFFQAPRDKWRWRLRIAMPDDVIEAEVTGTVRAAVGKRGGKLENSLEAVKVFLEHVPALRFGRALHVGPYAEEPRTLTAIHGALSKEGLAPAYAHVEVFVSDPRRTLPAKLRTVLLREVKAAPTPTKR